MTNVRFGPFLINFGPFWDPPETSILESIFWPILDPKKCVNFGPKNGGYFGLNIWLKMSNINDLIIEIAILYKNGNKAIMNLRCNVE